MADTEKSEQPQTNGLENGLDDDERSKMRPADIDADVKEMERRKRVEMIMSSKLFREELERIIELQLKDGNGPAGLLQQISDMMGIQSGKLHTAHMFRGSNCVTPINDIRGVESMGYEKGEKNLRCKLASVFRLMDLYGWSQGINNQITARLNQDEEHFLVNPHGMLFNEITASSLVKVDMQGNIVEPGTTNFSVNTQGFLLHSAIHASRPDVNCVIHIKTPSVLAVSSLKCGLLPICQEALVIGEVSQHPFVSGIFEPEEREKIIRNLGPHNKVLLLHNHGAVCCGATIEEAFYNVYNTVLACETQMKLMPIGVENLLLVSDETRKQVYDAAHRAPDSSGSSDKKKFRVGEMEFEALIRMLDNAGFRTGYIYRHPLVKGELPKPKNDVEVPPAVSSLGYLIEQEELYKQGNWKKYVDGRNRLDRTKWLNSPNVYQKVEILETGTSDPKKITKWVDQNSEEWVAESSPTHSSTPVKIDSALQFVPKGTNPKEFKKLQQQIKENRRADKITSGPQSHILEGVSWEEAKKLQDANITQTGDQVILVGAASKGIIQRNYQHNALVYKTPYAKNPFDSMSDKEIEDYKQLVERKQRGDTDYEESQSESEAISSSRQDGLRHFKSPLLSPQSATSETEEESRDEPRVLRIETKTAPRPIQAEVVLSDAESDTTDARVERSHSARYPKAEKPESVTLMNSFRKSWSLKREKDKSKDVEIYDSRNLHSSLILKECEQDRMESLHYCVARIKQLTHKPVIVDICTKALRPLLKSASDPCNLSTLNEDVANDENRQGDVSRDPNTSRSCGNIAMSELQQRLHIRKRLLHSAKMKFLGYQRSGSEEAKGETPTSPMRALISEIRETISEIMSPERSTTLDEPENYFSSMRWIERPNFVSRSTESELRPKEKSENLKSRISLSRSFNNLNSGDERSEPSNEFKSDFQVLKLDLDNSDRSDTTNCNCALHKGNISDDSNVKPKFDENQNEEKQTENVVTEIVRYVNASDEEATYTITDDSLLQTYSFTESTETEWYYNKTIMKLENSQTVLEIKEAENKENLEPVAIKYIDTGIDTDFTSEKENDSKHEYLPAEEGKETVETTEDIDADAPVGESSTLNKSSETDSSFLKTSSGRTSNDVDTSFAFKTETENSDKSPEKSSRSGEEKKKLLEEMLLKTKEPIEEESSDSAEAGEIPEESEKRKDAGHPRLPDIPESPEFTNIDTEDAPVTSSSKDTSPDVAEVTGHRTEDEPSYAGKEQEGDFEAEKESLKPEHRRKKNVKSSTKITVKKELKEKDSKDPVVSEIRLTIKNHSAGCQSEKYEVKIQDLTNTSEDLSRSVSSADSFVQNVDSYESIEIMEKSCECEAQQNLEELQGEVTSTIEKLHTIEDYFEDEIKKHSSFNSERMRNGFDECTIEYNYREFEEVLNESQGEIAEKVAERHETPATRKNAEFFMSSPLGDVVGEIEVCDDIDKMEMFPDVFGESTNEPPVMHPNNIDEDLAMSSAFVAAVLSEAVMEREICTNGPQEFVAGEVEPGDEGGQIVIYNMEELLRGDGKEVVESDVAEFFADIIDGLKVEEATVETSDCLLMESDIGQQQPSEANDSGHWEMPENIGEEQDLQMEEDRRFEKREPGEFVITEECLGFDEVSNTGQLTEKVIDSEENRQFVAERKDELTFISEVSEQKISECQLEEAAIIVSTEVVVTDSRQQSREEYQYYAFKDEIMAMEENCHLQNEHQFLAQNDAKNEQESNGQFPTEDKGPVLEEQLLKEIIEPVTEQQLSEESEKVVVERQHISEESDPTVVEQQQLLQENIEILIKRLPLENDQPVVEELPRENTEFITEQLPEQNNGLLVEKLNQENSDPIKMQLPEEIDKPVLVLYSSKGEGDHIQEQHLMEKNDNDKEEYLLQQNHGLILGQLLSEENIRVRQQQKLVDENSGPTQGEQLPEDKCGPVLKQQFPEESDSSIVKQQLPQKGNGTIPEDDTKTEPSIEKVVLVPEEELLEGNSGSALDLHLQNLVGLVSEENTVVLEEIKSSDENADTMLDEQKPEGKAVGPVLKQELPEGNDLIKTPVLEQQQQFLEVNNENSQEQQVLQEIESPLVQKQLSSENVPVWEAELNEGNEGVLLREKLPKEMSGHTLKQQLSEGNDKHLLEEPLLEGNADVMVEQQLTEEINGHVLEEVFPEEKGGPILEQQFHKVSDIHLQEQQLSQESDNSLMQHQLSSENAPVSEEQLPERDDVLVGEKLPEEMGEHMQKLQLPQENDKSMLEKQFPAESNDKPLTEHQPDSAKEQHKDTQQPLEDPDDSKVLRVLFPPQLKAIISDSDFDDPLSPIDHILNCLLNSVMHDVKNTTSVNDVINFLVTNEESPTESLAEFEDMENLISVSSSVIADIIDSLENQFEKEAESLPEEESKEGDGGRGEKQKKKRKGESMFKVTIATPAKKEIFINYSLDCSTTFNTSTDSADLCNSYIKTDDVNEDFENYSSDNPEFFSAASSGKTSLNNSFCSAESHVTAENFCCVGCEDNSLKSPHFLAIIQEVDEDDSSTSSDAAAPRNPN